MSSAEQQEEEREVLSSIYEGDDNFKQVSDTVFQYKIGEDGHHQSLLLEISWNESYPDESPKINLDAFYNKNILPVIKNTIVEKLNEQADMFLGTAMTYSLFEWVKENQAELMADQPVVVTEQATVNDDKDDDVPHCDEKKVKERKIQLTKAQKRRIINRVDLKTGERPRGWNWVDIIRHLSQTGAKE